MAKKKIVQAGEFKATCLKIMDQVFEKQCEVVVTKRKIPIVKLVPFSTKKKKLFGCMKGTLHILEDIIQPIDEVWNACS